MLASLKFDFWYGNNTTPEYTKNKFNSKEKFFGIKPLPNELINADNNLILGLDCTPQYTFNYNSRSYVYHNSILGLDDILFDSELVNFANQVSLSVKEGQITYIKRCITEDNKKIIIYSDTDPGGAAGQNTYFALVNKDNTLGKSIKIPSESIPYFNCYRPLQFVKPNLFYYECGGGDGPSSGQSIYKINFNTNSYTTLIRCYAKWNIKEEKSVSICN